MTSTDATPTKQTGTAPRRVPFIPVWLDNAKLTPPAFRVLCNLWRRRNRNTGQCNPSAKVIGADCGLHRDTVWKALDEIESAGLIVRKKEGFRLSNNYTLIVRPTGGNNRPIEGDQLAEETGHQLAEITGHQLAEETGHQGTQGKDHKRRITIKGAESACAVIGLTSAIFNAYPRKVGRPQALAAITKALTKTDAAALLAIVKAYAAAVALWPADDRQYVPHPATWFNSERYTDDPKTWERTGKSNARFGQEKGADHAGAW